MQRLLLVSTRPCAPAAREEGRADQEQGGDRNGHYGFSAATGWILSSGMKSVG